MVNLLASIESSRRHYPDVQGCRIRTAALLQNAGTPVPGPLPWPVDAFGSVPYRQLSPVVRMPAAIPGAAGDRSENKKAPKGIPSGAFQVQLLPAGVIRRPMARPGWPQGS